MKFTNLKIGTRLAAGFFLLLALMGGLTVCGLIGMREIHNRLTTIVEVNNYKTNLLQDMSEAVHAVTHSISTLVLLHSDGETVAERAAEMNKILEDARVKYDRAVQALEKTPTSASGRILREQIAASRKEARRANEKVIELANDNKKEVAIAMLINTAEPLNIAWQTAMKENIQLQKKANQAEAAAASAVFDNAELYMKLFAATAFFLGIGIAWLITRSISRPITSAMQIAQTVARGDLTSHIEVISKDETGQLLLSLKDMNGNLVNIVTQVRRGTEAIATASSQIASGNLDLSSRTEEQASSLEETASSMEQLTSTVRHNLDNARQANQLASKASDVASRGGEVVAQVVTTMGCINDASKKISDIIGVIDGIAFQTNILALNAAVEAARAGEQGRGFAVVATEVRNLAQRSSAAAKDIRLLISSSVEKIDAGGQLVEEAGRTMEEIVLSVRQVTDIMKEITAASEEQSAGIEQVNQAITQMDQVTQQNAALVEEAAAAAEGLREQASNLAKVVSVFRLDDMHIVSATTVTSKESPKLSTEKKNDRKSIKHEKSNSNIKRHALASTSTMGNEWGQF